jgi:phospho-N-acetylmuramoyl-pentapeptide-transferase
MLSSLPDLIRILVPAAAAFGVGILLTPILTHYLYAFKAWKKKPGKRSLDGSNAEEFNRLHEQNEIRAPRMGGIVIWGSVAITMLGIALIAQLIPGAELLRLDFLSRNQTWIPLAVLLVGSFVGLVDDLLVIRPNGEGLPLRLRLLSVVVLSAFIGWWFWDKLDVVAINIPFTDPLVLGWFIVPFFVFMSLCLYASGVIDGIDGLSGGVFASIFASYTIIAFAQNQINLAAFAAAIVGGLLAFLWYNIPPARFYMSDTGTMGLTLNRHARVYDRRSRRRCGNFCFAHYWHATCSNSALRRSTNSIETLFGQKTSQSGTAAPSFRSDWLARVQGRHAILGALGGICRSRCDHRACIHFYPLAKAAILPRYNREACLVILTESIGR